MGIENFGAKDIMWTWQEKNTKAIKEYIENQLKVDRESDQISLYAPRDPFTGSK